MAVYRPKYRDRQTGELVESEVWWYEFTFAGKRYRESTKTTRKTLATDREKRRRLELERAITTGQRAPNPGLMLRTVKEAAEAYATAYDAPNHQPKSIRWVKDRNVHLVKHLGAVAVLDLTENRILAYMRLRHGEDASNRTINMELLCLSRAVNRTWDELWPGVPRLEEPSDVGRALAPDEEGRILGAAAKNKSPYILPYIQIALMTGMRSGEIRTLQLNRLDLQARELKVGKAKTPAGRGRGIPMNPELYQAIAGQVEWLKKTFGRTKPDWYLFPFCDRVRPIDPARPVTTIKTSWESVRTAANVECRFHDLRHTAATKLAESGVPEATMKALLGHMSQRMVERYSHIRNAAKRQAVEGLTLAKPIEVPKVSPKVRPIRELKAVGK